MNPREQGFLLLTSQLGDPARRPLTVAQFRTLIRRVGKMQRPTEQRHLLPSDFLRMGYDQETALRIVSLFSSRALLEAYLERGWQQDCIPITRVSPEYPGKLRKCLGTDCPGCLWAKGDVGLLHRPAAALVGARDLHRENRLFAEEAGRQAARQGYVLVSGNARGADQTAQNACLAAGGCVISVVADMLCRHPLKNKVLYLSEEEFDSDFSAYRALSRNRVIHCLGDLTLVAQSRLGRGGTWDGTVKNLRHCWSPVFCCNDQAESTSELEQRGARPISPEELADFEGLRQWKTDIRMEELL